MVWDAFTVLARGIYISMISAICSEQSLSTSNLQQQVEESTNQHTLSPTPKNFDHLMWALHLHLAEVASLV